MRKGSVEIVEFAVVAIPICFLIILLTSVFAGTKAAQSLAKAVPAVSRAAAVSGSMDDAKKHAEEVAKAAVDSRYVQNLSVDIQMEKDGEEWGSGKMIRVELSGNTEPLLMITKSHQKKSYLVTVESGGYVQTDATGNELIIIQKLQSMGVGQGGIAAMLGNIYQESRFSISDPTSGHYGIIQWGGGRLAKLKAMYPTSWQNIEGQVNYMEWEMTQGGYQSCLAQLKACGTSETEIWQCVDYIARHYEICGSYAVETPRRNKFAQYFMQNGHLSGYD